LDWVKGCAKIPKGYNPRLIEKRFKWGKVTRKQNLKAFSGKFPAIRHTHGRAESLAIQKSSE